MKNSIKKILVLLWAVITVTSLLSCGEAAPSIESPEATTSQAPIQNGEIPAEGLWKDATYRTDASLGSGAKTIYVEIKVGDSSVTFTLKTDKETVGAALLEHSLIDGEQGAYGLYVKKVNGITADYNIDKSYWGFYSNGKYMMTGVDQTEITNGMHYELVYEK